MVTFQEIIRRLDEYWAAQGCAILQGYDVEVGAGTVQPSRRPADGRYTRNPMRNQRYYQYQVVMKPSPDNIVDLYMGSLNAIGFDTKKNDIRLVEDDWESQAAGAAGVGWEVWVDGTEVTQFTFFQQMGGYDCDPVCAEITYGPERLCLMLNNQNSFWSDLQWNEAMTYKDTEYDLEMQHNVYNFEVANTEMLLQIFDLYEAESKRVIETPVFWDEELDILTTKEASERKGALVYPALDLALKCSHIFNVLDARGAISVTERAAYINRIRGRIRACCGKYLDKFKTATPAG